MMRKLTNSTFWGLLLALSLSLAVVPAAGAQSASDPAALMTAFEKVAFGSNQDAEAALALFTDNAVLTVMPAPAGTSGVWTGKEEIRKALQINKQLNVARVNTGTPKVEGNKVTTTAKVTNNYFQMLGLGPVDHTTEVLVEDRKIISYTSKMVAAEQARVAAAAQAYQDTHPAQQPPSVPSTGIGQQSAVIPGTTIDLTCSLAGLLAICLVSLGAIIFMGARTKRQLK